MATEHTRTESHLQKKRRGGARASDGKNEKNKKKQRVVDEVRGSGHHFVLHPVQKFRSNHSDHLSSPLIRGQLFIRRSTTAEQAEQEAADPIFLNFWELFSLSVQCALSALGWSIMMSQNVVPIGQRRARHPSAIYVRPLSFPVRCSMSRDDGVGNTMDTSFLRSLCDGECFAVADFLILARKQHTPLHLRERQRRKQHTNRGSTRSMA